MITLLTILLVASIAGNGYLVVREILNEKRRQNEMSEAEIARKAKELADLKAKVAELEIKVEQYDKALDAANAYIVELNHSMNTGAKLAHGFKKFGNWIKKFTPQNVGAGIGKGIGGIGAGVVLTGISIKEGYQNAVDETVKTYKTAVKDKIQPVPETVKPEDKAQTA